MKLKKYIFYSVPCVFTIEASVILPITFVIIAAFITISFSIHNKVISYTQTIDSIIENAPDGIKKSESEYADSSYAGAINTDNLDGRKVLLKYRLLKDGLKKLSGGLDEDED